MLQKNIFNVKINLYIFKIIIEEKILIYEFEVIGKIVGKQRPRVNTYTYNVYTPNKTKDYEEYIQQNFKIKYPIHKMLEKRISIEITAFLEIPKNTSKKKSMEMVEGIISPTKKPDIDNIAKSVLDALNKFVFKDDNQVTRIMVEKKYSEIEKIYVKIEEY